MPPDESERNLEIDNIDKFAEEFKKWILTPDGKASINDALKTANEIADKVKEANRIDQELLKMHITV